MPDGEFWTRAQTRLGRRLERISTPVELAAKQTLFELGDIGDSAYVIERGELVVSTVSSDGRKLSLDILHPGMLVGEIALFDDGPRTASIAAWTDTRLLRVSRADLAAMLTQDPDLALELLQLAARRMRYLTNQIQQQSLNPLPQRLAQKILHLLSFDKKQSLVMSQADLADFLGATREAVSRILTTWKKSGILDLRRGQIAILDRSAIERIAYPEKMSEV